MATKTINLKMVLNRKAEGKELRQALWTTHEEINKAVAEIEEILLLCRGESYWIHGKDKDGKDIDVEVDEKTIEKKLLEHARKQQEKNGKPNTGSDEEIKRALKQLYDSLIAAGAKGVRQYGSPLMNKDSKGGDSAKQKIFEPWPPEWVTKMESNIVGWEQESIRWIQSPEVVEKLKSKAFNDRSPWFKENKAVHFANTNWQKAFVSDQKNQRKSIQPDGSSGIIGNLRSLGLLPLFSPPIKLANSKQKKKEDVVGTWNQMALKVAVQQRSGWKECDERTNREYEKLKNDRDKQQSTVDEYYEKKTIDKIRAYENDRKERTQAKYDYVIKRREIRSWEKVLKEWRKSGCNSEQDRLEVLNKLQKKLKGRFGDRDVLNWLAKDENKDIWQKNECLTDVVKLNGLNFKLDPDNPNHKKDHAACTVSEPRIHPCWACYAPKGGNLENYVLYYDDNNKVSAKLDEKSWDQIRKGADGQKTDGKSLFIAMSLLCKDGANLTSVPFQIKLSPSEQIKNLVITKIVKEKKKEIQEVIATFTHSGEIDENRSPVKYTAKLSESAMLFDRSFMERDKDNKAKFEENIKKLRDGDFGEKHNAFGIWFKLVCDVENLAPKEWLKNDKICIPDLGLRYSISDAAFKKKGFKQIGDIWPGLRIMSVDMGLRNFASCSIFEIVSEEPPAGKIYYEAVKDKLWAVHVTSFIINLPGEKISPIPPELWQELNNVEDMLEFQRAFVKLQNKDTVQERKECLEQLQRLDFDEVDNPTKINKKLLTPEIFYALNNAITDDNWLDICQKKHREVEVEIGNRMSGWRNLSSYSMRIKRLSSKLIKIATFGRFIRQKTLAKLQKNREFSFAENQLKNLSIAIDLDAKAWTKQVQECVDVLIKDNPTYSIGLSLSGLEYLTRVRNLIKSWSAHPQKPDDKRTNEEGFASHLLEHINMKKEDRIKKGADLIIQTARGLKYSEKNHKWEQKFEPCRLILFEKLESYRFETGRSRKENKKLMQWSHREIVKEVEMQAEMYGIIIGLMDADYTSRYCAVSGIPGIRAKELTVDDLMNQFQKEKLEKLRVDMKLPELLPNMIVPWELGELFVAIDKNQAMIKHHADINAARNLQRRFATAYGDMYKITVTHNKSENCWIPETVSPRLQRAISNVVGGKSFCKFTQYNGYFLLQGIDKEEFKRLGGKVAKDSGSDNHSGNDEHETTKTAKKGKKFAIYRYLTDNEPKESWYNYGDFWEKVENAIYKELGKSNINLWQQKQKERLQNEPDPF